MTEQTIDVAEQIQTLKDFIETNSLPQVLEAARTGQTSILIDFAELSRFTPEVADLLLDQPEEVLKAIEIAIEQIDLPQHKPFQVRLFNLPKTQKMMIREVRSKQIGRLLHIEGIVRTKSDVRPQVTIARFECPACGNVISVPQLDVKFREPTSCSCGRKGKFRLLAKEMVDAQGLILEESPYDLEGGEQPKRLNVFLKNDLVSPLTERKTNPGTVIKVFGVLKEVPIAAKDGGKLTRFDLVLDANNIETTEEDFGELAISEEEIKQINDLASQPKIMNKMVNSIAPDIYGHERIKEALVLQLFGGVRKHRRRGDVHVLLLGDPGAGKSALLKNITEIAPKARYVAGKGASGTGLTAAVIKDEFLKGWSLEAGALVLANRGICCIDELDKMTVEDTSSLHEALEQQTISISKANIQATLRAETTVLAAANPKHGRFDQYGSIPEQINLPSTLINRFDLIFPIKDLPDPTKDTEMSSFILNLHQNKTKEAEIPKKILRKYIAYAKKINPVLTDEAIKVIQEYYLRMRSSGTNEGGQASIPISARQLEGLVRLSEASARARLSDKVTKKDANRAIDLVHYCLSQIGMDLETGKIDIDKISTGITTSQRNKMNQIRELVKELANKYGGLVAKDILLQECEVRGIDRFKAEEYIEKLNREGDLIEPRKGYWQAI